MVDDYAMGFNCKNGDPGELAEKLLALCQDAALRDAMAGNSRRLAEEKFDRRRTYGEIIGLVRELTADSP